MPEPITPTPPPAVPAGQPAEPAKPPVPTAPKPAEPTQPKTGEPSKATTDEPLGEGGIKALQAERAARQALEKKLEALAPLEKIAAALGGGDATAGKSEIELITERLTNHETELGKERSARWRAEIAIEKGLTVQQASRLVGSSRDELAADADALQALFPTAPAAPGTPKPDPSQGGRGGASVDLDSKIQEAQKKGDFRSVIALQNQKFANQ
jgi:hypothetical protein